MSTPVSSTTYASRAHHKRRPKAPPSSASSCRSPFPLIERVRLGMQRAGIHPWSELGIVRIETDGGIVGWGETTRTTPEAGARSTNTSDGGRLAGHRPADGSLRRRRQAGGRPGLPHPPLHQFLGDLHRVEGRSLAQLVAADPQVQSPAIRPRNVLADPPDQNIVLTRGFDGHGEVI